MTDNIYKTITFNKEVTSIIEKYMQDNNCTFNKAVNEIIKKYKKDVINIEMSKEIETINNHLKGINNKLDKLLKPSNNDEIENIKSTLIEYISNLDISNL